MQKGIVCGKCYHSAMLFFAVGKEKKMQRRKDSRGRVLEKGESQRKDGRYVYQYIDNWGLVNQYMH